MLIALSVLALASLITLYLLNIDWIYYGLAGWNVVVSIGLYSALAYLMARIAPVYHIVNM